MHFTIHLVPLSHLLQPCLAHLHCKGSIDLLVVPRYTYFCREEKWLWPLGNAGLINSVQWHLINYCATHTFFMMKKDSH